MSDTTRHYAWPDTSHWSTVASAGEPGSPERQEAMDGFCATFRGPVYSFLRRDGCDPDEAQDLAQEFFLYVLGESRPLSGYDRQRGPFRAYLLGVLRNFRANRRRNDSAEKRGGRKTHLSIDHPGHLAHAVADHTATPDVEFTRAWAAALLNRVVARLREEATERPRRPPLEPLLARLIEGRSESYEATAASLGMTPGALRVAAHRLRERFELLLRQEIARTVSSPEEIDDEIRAMFAAFSPHKR